MAEELNIGSGTKAERYELLIRQLTELVRDEPDYIANCANICAALRQTFNFFWVGFYFVKENELVLGPFQGDIACTRIAMGKGVCGTCWEQQKTIIVPDVDAFPGHIACSSSSRSEIVVPVIKSRIVRCVLDVDSDVPNDFDETDAHYLEIVASLVADFPF